MKETKVKAIRYSICFLLIALLCWMFPYSGDDWAWGSEIGIHRLDVWFYKYNGRYVGNLIVLALTRSNLLKTLVMAFCLTGIIYLTEYISKRKWAFYVSCIALVLIPKGILKQAVVWTSGFSNYVIPVFLVLIFIAYMYPIFNAEMPKYKLWHCLPLLLLGFIDTQLVEHMTVYNVVLAVGVIVYTIAVHRRVAASHAAYLIGSIAGAAYMFSNGAYHNIVSGGNTYQQVAEGGILSSLEENYVKEIAPSLCLNNIWLNLGLLFVCFLLFRQCAGHWDRRRELWMAKLSLFIMAAFNAWAVLSVLGIGVGDRKNRLLYVEALFVAVYMAALISFVILIGLKKNCIWKLLFWCAGIVCITAPLFVCKPIGARCFFPTYVLFLLLLIEMTGQLEGETIKEVLAGSGFRRVCICISLAGLAFYLNIFSSIYQVDRDRLAKIERQVAEGADSVKICRLPYDSYLWTSTPMAEPWITRYKLFHGLPKDLEIKVVNNYKKKG